MGAKEQLWWKQIRDQITLQLSFSFLGHVKQNEQGFCGSVARDDFLVNVKVDRLVV